MGGPRLACRAPSVGLCQSPLSSIHWATVYVSGTARAQPDAPHVEQRSEVVFQRAAPR